MNFVWSCRRVCGWSRASIESLKSLTSVISPIESHKSLSSVISWIESLKSLTPGTVHCSVLQCNVVCYSVCYRVCSVLQCVLLCSSRWFACQHAQHCSVLQYIAACCSVLHCVLHCVALCYSNWCACQHARFATIIYCHITIQNFPVWVPIISLPHELNRWQWHRKLW